MADDAKPVGEDTPSADGIIHQLATLDAIQLGRVITAAEKQRTAKLQDEVDPFCRTVWRLG